MKHISLKIAALGAALILLGAGCSKDGVVTITPEPLENRPPQSTTYPITFNPSDVTPKEITIKLGDSIEFRNSDLKDHWPASAPHPSHSAYPEFDSKKALKPGDIWTFKFEKAGTWKFHDHLNGRNTKFQGTVIVQ